ncbi:Hsp20/alpha crystallin family protein [Singulisphaera sp. PoT]|uniref:Hsp20/alpha crystallin family protein n=1 Tax=Singulisphaera sp. PoT TaxID=3411797 RepID=UPI003BF467C7
MGRPMTGRRDLTAPLNLIQSELNRFFEEYWNPARIGPAAASAPVDVEPTAWSPAIDIFETPQEIVVFAELPGVEPTSIDLSLTGNVLSLRGVKVAEPNESDGPVRERRFGAFHRQLTLSEQVNFDAAQAEARHGVLKIRLPKKEAAIPRTIPVQVIGNP